MLLGGTRLCEDAKGMQGWDEIHRKSVRGSMSCKVPRPHQDLREAVEGWGRRTQRARKAQVYGHPASPVLGDFKGPGCLSALELAKDFPLQPLIP